MQATAESVARTAENVVEPRVRTSQRRFMQGRDFICNSRNAPAVFIAIVAATVYTALNKTNAPRVFETHTLEKIARRQQPLLLLIVGEVFDVSSGKEFYARGDGKEESYAGYANGTDNTRAFLTADFENNATDDLSGLLPGECLGIEHWSKFYHNHSTYRRVGIHHGRFYDANGQPTEEHAQFRRCVSRGYEAHERAREAMLTTPECDQVKPEGEARFQVGVWWTYSCDAPRVPRKMPMPGGGTCACIRLGEDVEGGWGPAAALGMEDDEKVPQRFGGCTDRDASVCTARIA